MINEFMVVPVIFLNKTFLAKLASIRFFTGVFIFAIFFLRVKSKIIRAIVTLRDMHSVKDTLFFFES